MTEASLRTFNRIITYNEPLNDGTPRRESGYRCHLQWPFDTPRENGRIKSRIYISHILRSEEEAKRWYPSVVLIADHWSFAP